MPFKSGHARSGGLNRYILARLTDVGIHLVIMVGAFRRLSHPSKHCTMFSLLEAMTFDVTCWLAWSHMLRNLGSFILTCWLSWSHMLRNLGSFIPFSLLEAMTFDVTCWLAWSHMLHSILHGMVTWPHMLALQGAWTILHSTMQIIFDLTWHGCMATHAFGQHIIRLGSWNRQ